MAATVPKRPKTKALKLVEGEGAVSNAYLKAIPKAKSIKAKKVLATLAKLPPMSEADLTRFNQATRAFSGRIFRG